MNNRNGIVATLIVAVFSFAGLNANADLIGLQKIWPDIFSSGILVNYDAATDAFSADGQASVLELANGGPSVSISNGEFTLDAIVDGTGAASSGTLVIAGDVTIPDVGAVSGNLIEASLRSDVQSFGFGEDAGTFDLFEFRWDVTGGLLQGLLLAEYNTTTVETILDAEFGQGAGPAFSGSFESDFTNAASFGPLGFGVSDTFIPVPGSFAMGMVVMGGIMMQRRRKAC